MYNILMNHIYHSNKTQYKQKSLTAGPANPTGLV